MNISIAPKKQQADYDTLADAPVEMIMTRSLHTVRMSDTVADALLIMTDGINTLPVTNYKAECIGMLSRSDLTEFLYREDQTLTDSLETEGAPPAIFGQSMETCRDRLVRELMTDVVTFADPGTTVRDACKLMSAYDIHHLPVIDRSRRLIGMVSSLDLIRLLAD